ncbi:sensor histidine kinase GlrK [Ferrovum sp. JA12]|uniref:sensor histidine kinase n=1 Tax=Ferrovum sp. JA12 TaxID=1356299 RepID=UPI000703B40B|nr:HAMP domain-containing sensor histidine kinase [Ferrovum sp. JA12]KRH78208.1 sensor histidine kinase GlrK [Ferrovum sp. JA12]
MIESIRSKIDVKKTDSIIWGQHFPLSFRQLLLLAFISIILLLGGALIRTLVSLQNLSQENVDYPNKMLFVLEQIHELQDTTVSLERKSRQYMVLNDPSMIADIKKNWSHGEEVANSLKQVPAMGLQSLVDEWLQLSQFATDSLTDDASLSFSKQQDILNSYAQLGEIIQRVDLSSRDYLKKYNQTLIFEFKRQRDALITFGIFASLFAVMLALILGMWLSQSLREVEMAIDQLGTEDKEQPVFISGPADMRRLGERIEVLRQRLNALEADKLLFMRHISHELKTPLANLREGIALLEDQVMGHMNTQQTEIIHILRDNALSLQQQIESLLQYNAFSEDTRRLHLHCIDVLELLKELISRYRLQLQSRFLTIDLIGEPLKCLVDSDKIEIIINNLLSNAVRFSPEQGLIKLTLIQHQAWLRIDCEDQGPGIALEDREKIFNPFYQGARQPTGSRKGSGIGLSIVKELVSAHGGQVSLMPCEEGSYFRVEIPYEAC